MIGDYRVRGKMTLMTGSKGCWTGEGGRGTVTPQMLTAGNYKKDSDVTKREKETIRSKIKEVEYHWC